jgi:hypothetical protein
MRQCRFRDVRRLPRICGPVAERAAEAVDGDGVAPDLAQGRAQCSIADPAAFDPAPQDIRVLGPQDAGEDVDGGLTKRRAMFPACFRFKTAGQRNERSPSSLRCVIRSREMACMAQPRAVPDTINIEQRR